jgi:hypothetical protein
MGKKTEKQRNAQTRKPTEKRKVSLSSVTKQYKGWSNKNKASFWLILIVAIAVPVSILTALSASISQLPSKEFTSVKINVINAGDFTNMTEKYSVTIYVDNLTNPIDNTTFSYYKSWMVGTNGSAKDVDVKIGDTFNGTSINEFILRFQTA